MMRNIFHVLVLISFVFLSMQSAAFALPQEDERALINDSVYYDRDAAPRKCGGGSESINELPSEVPQPYRELFPEAAEEHNTDLSLLTYVFFWENRGFPDADTDWPTSSAGAEGPFQFLPDTWEAYGVDGDGDGDADIQDVTDATYGAANFLNSLGGTPDSSIGSIDNPYEEGTLVYVMGAYNYGPANMEDQESLPQETEDYINRGSSFIRDLRSGTVNLDTDPDAGGGESSSTTTAPAGCGGLGVGEDLVFPLKTTKSAIREGASYGGSTLDWCYENQTNCHSAPDAPDLYKAADIFVEPGTEVVAATGGTVIDTNPAGRSLSVRIHGENGNYYHYQHMEPHSERISENDNVEAGDVIGVIGGPEAAFDTAPHLHFDVATENVGISRDCVSNGNCEYEKSVMIDSQPDLVEAYEELPEE